MRREEWVTVQGPVKEHQPDGMSHRGGGGICVWVWVEPFHRRCPAAAWGCLAALAASSTTAEVLVETAVRCCLLCFLTAAVAGGLHELPPGHSTRTGPHSGAGVGTPATTSTSSICQLLGAADAQTAHHATFSTVPTHQLRGSANAETTPARAPAAAANRKQRPDATCEGKKG